MPRSSNASPLLRRLGRLFSEPVSDYMNALQNCMSSPRAGGNALRLASCLAASWWLYVPTHELLHVAGCIVAGGNVTRLEMEPMYGAALLKPLFPFISVGSEYAGRLSGFDTRGSDLVYLLTDFAPFLLTILFGVPLVRWVAHAGSGAPRNALLFGFALPWAYAPLISIFGDYYEMGSILVTRAAALTHLTPFRADVRGDDLIKVIEPLWQRGLTATDVALIGTSLALGIALVLATLELGARVGSLLLSLRQRAS